MVAHLVALDDADATDIDRLRAGSSLQEAGNRAGLEALAAASDSWYAALRQRLAAVGVLDAQLAELAELAEQLRAGTRPDPSQLQWLSGVSDPAALDALKDVLIAAGCNRVSTTFPDVTIPVLNAITRMGLPTAVDFVDDVVHERPYPGAQFLVDERDRLLQFLLEPVARAAAQERAAALGLHVAAEEA